MKHKLEHSPPFLYNENYYRFADYFRLNELGEYSEKVLDWIDSWVEKQIDDKWIKLNPKESQDIIDLYWEEWGKKNGDLGELKGFAGWGV